VADVYGLVFAPFAAEDVFLKESTMVADVLAQRFDAKGRVLQLVNHVRHRGALPWATPLNLQRAIEAIGERMNRDEDVLVVYLTSHGAQNFRLAAEHGPAAGGAAQPQRAAHRAGRGAHPPPRDRDLGLLLRRLGRPAGRRPHAGDDGG
jgi:hypothetical protein